ncbi:MAG: NADH-quinone oxidoreductase subunit N [Verrucomicrobia subdivision 3 bacterium]|nr:NADH-quinone oxidoreductase subunit N [Limisphaerales bacterium]
MSYLDVLILACPETIVALAALVVLALDLAVFRRRPWATRMRFGALAVTIGCLAALSWLWGTIPVRPLLHSDDVLVLNSLTHLIKIVVLLLTILTAWISIESQFTDHVGEYFALLLFGTLGMMFLVSTENLLMIFVALELLSLCLYTMTAFNKQNVRSAEAALKYFLFGGMSAAFLLFGFSLVYGLTGEITLGRIGRALNPSTLQPFNPSTLPDPLLIVALIMVMAGFGFKVAAVPFHLWAPDAYQGAPTPTAAFIASGSKVASFFILAKLLVAGFAGAGGAAAWRGFTQGWMPLVAILAALSIAVGNVAAIAQSSVRRLLAYSAIAHAGYALVGVLAFGSPTPSASTLQPFNPSTHHGFTALIYYVVTYACTALGAFGVVAIVEGSGSTVQRFNDSTVGPPDDLRAFAGLGKRAPLLSFCMLIFILSLAGIPPLAGFFGKFYLFAAALSSGKDLALLWLVVFAIAMTAVSLYYYLQVLKQIYVAPPPRLDDSTTQRFNDSTTQQPFNPSTLQPITPSWPAQASVVILAAAVVILGLAPNLLVGRVLGMVDASRLFLR